MSNTNIATKSYQQFIVLLGVAALLLVGWLVYQGGTADSTILQNQQAIAAGVGKANRAMTELGNDLGAVNATLAEVDENVNDLPGDIRLVVREELAPVRQLAQENRNALYSGNAQRRHEEQMARIQQLEGRLASVEAVQQAARQGAADGVQPGVQAMQQAADQIAAGEARAQAERRAIYSAAEGIGDPDTLEEAVCQQAQ